MDGSDPANRVLCTQNYSLVRFAPLSRGGPPGFPPTPRFVGVCDAISILSLTSIPHLRLRGGAGLDDEEQPHEQDMPTASRFDSPSPAREPSLNFEEQSQHLSAQGGHATTPYGTLLGQEVGEPSLQSSEIPREPSSGMPGSWPQSRALHNLDSDAQVKTPESLQPSGQRETPVPPCEGIPTLAPVRVAIARSDSVANALFNVSGVPVQLTEVFFFILQDTSTSMGAFK